MLHITSVLIVCESSALVVLPDANVESMKKVKLVTEDELRPEYKREDFGPMVRGKYAARLKAASNIVVLKPEVAKAFPNAEAVNDALMSLINLAKTAARPRRSTPARAKAARRLTSRVTNH
ncbi:MAG TPA: hypothetical protein VLA73_10470 [Burkholderiales bacterium]|nr:hypothetical protein [Burkholderiales bacterium]